MKENKNTEITFAEDVKTIELAFVDRNWYSVRDGDIVGDMGFSFQDSPDTRVPISQYDEILSNAIDWVDDENNEWEQGDGVDDDFAIYELCKAKVEYTEEDILDEDIEHSLWALNLSDAEMKVTDIVLAIRKSEIPDAAKKAVEEYYKERHGLTEEHIHYREEEE